MRKIEKLSVTWSGLLPVIAKSLEEWRPPKQKSEIAYRDNLLFYMREILPEDANIEKEFRHRGTTMDLWLGWKGMIANDELAFELKINLKKKSDFDRLIGQIEGLDPRKNKTVVVLIGNTDPTLLFRLKEKYRNEIEGNFPTMAIITIPVTEE
ncbi:MAG: hypothetical protein LZF63_01080 [Nitrosomonas sp.]|nr:hypothetical protein [Nitrosomonas sp.]